MMKCDELKKLSWIEKEEKKNEALNHANECPECSAFKANYDTLMGTLKMEYTPSLNIYASIQSQLSKPSSIIPFPQKQVPVYSSAKIKWAIPVAASFLLAFFIAFYFNSVSTEQSQKPNPGHNAQLETQKIFIETTNEGILLTWNNSQKSEYIIYRTTNLRDFAHAKPIKVKGNKYLDKEALNYPIVYYKVL